MKTLLGKTFYKLSGICWRAGLHKLCYVFAGWGFRLCHKPKTYDR